MASPPDRDPDRGEALAWVHRGWDHLRLQRPLASWASWQRALRLAPGDPAATQALAILAAAGDLPAAARATYRFRPPQGDGRRVAWDAHFRGHDLADLDAAASAFAALAVADPEDAAAHYNHALALAWLGRNADAIAALDRFVTLEAAADFEAAVAAWTLAEVLRQGAGAEELADDMDWVVIAPWRDEDGDPTALDAPGRIVPRPAPAHPAEVEAPATDVRVYEWLDRPMPDPAATRSAEDLPRVHATILHTFGMLRISTPDGADFGLEFGDNRDEALRREATPLPLRLLDAAVWTYRFPPGLDDGDRRRLTREAVEAYYEERWVHRPRHSLGDDGPTPLEAGRRAAAGDAVARAKLAAAIRFREQLAARPRTAALYGGYPFDRLRRRVGLDRIDPTTVDPADYACMGHAELRRLDPSTLDEAALHEAARSARALADDDLTRTFLTAMAERFPASQLPDLRRDEPR